MDMTYRLVCCPTDAILNFRLIKEQWLFCFTHYFTLLRQVTGVLYMYCVQTNCSTIFYILLCHKVYNETDKNYSLKYPIIQTVYFTDYIYEARN